jgi:non-ribosomal peptide synthetase component E (peptide arylation enzyme)
VAFLHRSATVFPDEPAVPSDDRRMTYAQFAAEAAAKARGLRDLGVLVAHASPAESVRPVADRLTTPATSG